jgi:hypothetical protein
MAAPLRLAARIVVRNSAASFEDDPLWLTCANHSALVSFYVLQHDYPGSMQPCGSWYLDCHEFPGSRWSSEAIPGKHCKCLDLLSYGCVMLGFQCLGALYWNQRRPHFWNVC